MNLSGNAVRYWMNEKKIPIEQTLIVVDDLALPFGQLRLKPVGQRSRTQWVKHITQILGTQKYARLRFGIGNDFPKGGQVDFVLGKFEAEDLQQMPEALKRARRSGQKLRPARHRPHHESLQSIIPTHASTYEFRSTH